MQDRCTLFVATLFLSVLVSICSAQTPEKSKSFPGGIVLIGTQTHDDPDACQVHVISPNGKEIRTVFRRETGSFYPGGRLSRQADRLAFCYVTSGGKGEFWMIDSQGEATKIMDGLGMITAWSPDGNKLAYYGRAKDGSFESFVIDLTSGKPAKLELAADYLAEDWHPQASTRTAIYMNPRNLLYREKRGDQYPARQIDLLIADGKRMPITKDPSTDNIWARFSPTGERLAHYGRRLVGEKPLEYAVVCAADGSRPREVFSFTEFGDAAGLPWFRPKGPPAWSPDGSTLAWLVNTNTEPTGQGEQLELVLLPVDGGNPTRVSLTDKGFKWVTAIEWR